MGIQKKPIGMVWFSDALDAVLPITQTVLEREILLFGRFSFGKLKENEACVNRLIVAMRIIGSVSYKPLGL